MLNNYKLIKLKSKLINLNQKSWHEIQDDVQDIKRTFIGKFNIGCVSGNRIS